jgi:hemin uptake protein HemP
VTSPTVKKQDPSQTSGKPPRRVNSAQLLLGSDRLLIEHQGELYTLRQTRNGKLILTK